MLYLRTLGGLSLHRAADAEGQVVLANSKSLLVLAILATRSDHAMRRDRLAEYLWPGADRSRALRALRQALFFLRRYAADALESDDDAVRLRTERLDVDLWRFDRALEDQRWEDVVSLYRGPFAAGFERKGGVDLEHLLEAESSRVRAGVEIAYGKVVTAALQAGDVWRATRLARELVGMDPLGESAQRLLIRTLRAGGDDVGAVQAFESYRALLEGLLEERPDEGLRETISRLRHELLDASTVTPAKPDAPAAPAAPEPAIAASSPAGWTVVLRRVKQLPPTVRWAGVAVVALGAVVTGLGVLSGPTRAPDQLLAAAERRLLVSLEGQPSGRVAEVVTGGRAVTVRVIDDAPVGWLPSPDEQRTAFAVQAVDGWNVAVSVRGGESRVLTTAAGDELPLTWSPDGRYLLFTRRRLLADGRTEAFGYGMADVTLDTLWRFTSLETRHQPVARWAPDGTQIALTADVRGEPEIFVVDFDRQDVRDLSLHAAWDGDPAWSPDGGRLAFVSRRDGGDAQLYSVRRDGLDLLRISRTGTEERTPIWLTQDVIAYVSSGDVWATDVAGRTPVRLTERGDVSALVTGLGADGRWIDSIRIGHDQPTVSPGQFVRLTANAFDPAGKAVSLQMLPLHWVIADPALGRLERSHWLRIVGIGSTNVIADLAGWRADTSNLISLPLVIQPLEPVFVERWLEGLETERWRLYGTPSPYTRPNGAPGEAGVFLANGDEFFASGAITAVPFALSEGIVIEFDARLPFTRKLHQELVVALHLEALPDSALEANRPPPLVELRMVGPAGERTDSVALTVGSDREQLPMPDGIGLWHRYAVQIRPDGTVELLVDDRMFWRSGTRASTPRRAEAFLLLGGQSFETELTVGSVRVYRGMKFRLPELATPQP